MCQEKIMHRRKENSHQQMENCLSENRLIYSKDVAKTHRAWRGRLWSLQGNPEKGLSIYSNHTKYPYKILIVKPH